MSTLAYRPSISNSLTTHPSRPAVVDLGLLLAIALVAFELFSFDMSRYALGDLLADVSFAGLRWATILAIALCCIDFAGLLRFFALEQEQKNSAESWYWIGAWLLGGTMQALLAWWATATILVSHSSGSGLLSSPQMLILLPLFVAILVWVTRILFIGVLAVAGDSVYGYAKIRLAHTIRQPLMDYKHRTQSLRRQQQPLVDAPVSRPARPFRVQSGWSSSHRPVRQHPHEPAGKSTVAIPTTGRTQPIWLGA